MALNQKNVFWEALVISIFIFGAGLVLGILLENYRTTESVRLYLNSEINLLDVQLYSGLIEDSEENCELLIEENIQFGDMIYYDAQQIQKYEDANKITEEVLELHKKYDLLRTLFWINSIKIKESCKGNFSTVVYFYDYQSEEPSELATQFVFSQFLMDLKNQKEDKILLIPIAKNMDLSSLDFLMKKYDINQTSILVDETLVVNSEEELHKIEKYLS